jgi:DNA recombination protein RmuC
MLEIFLGFAIGILLGGIVAWILAARRAVAAAQPLATELRQQLTAREGMLEGLRQQLSAAETSRASIEAKLGALDERLIFEQADAQKLCDQLRADLVSREQTSDQLREQLVTAEKSRAALDEKVASLNERLERERAEFVKTQEQLRKDFEAVSHRLLVENATHFKQQSSESLEKLLAPLRENLKDFRKRLEETHKDAATHNAVLKEQIARIGSEAENLARALKGDVKVLGNWGEQRLDQILEKAGLQQGVHYERQQAATSAAPGEDEAQRRFLDVVVKLPEGRCLVIDSKVSLSAYEAHVNASSDPAAAAAHLQRHIEALRKHVRDLGGKRYHELYGIQTPDFVLMYVPLESAYFAALAQEPGLFAEALERNVVLITNSTLLATLRTVAHVWRLAAQQENAAEIARRGGALYDKFCGFITDLEDVGRALGAGQRSYDEAIKKLHTGRGNLLRQAEDLKKLGARAAKSLPAPLLERADDDSAEPTPALE